MTELENDQSKYGGTGASVVAASPDAASLVGSDLVIDGGASA
jgi:hypothetical protein